MPRDEVVGGVSVVVDCDGGGHDALAVGGDPVEASAGDFGDEAVTAELDDEPGDAFASPVGLGLVGWWPPVEAGGEVGVAEADDVVLADHGRFEESEVGGAEGVEPGDASPAVVSGAGTGRRVSRRLRLSWVRPRWLAGSAGWRPCRPGGSATGRWPLRMGHHRRERPPSPSVTTRRILNSRGLLMTVSTRKTDALS
jgi:hypothetical protein